MFSSNRTKLRNPLLIMNGYWGTLLIFKDLQFRTLQIQICPFVRDNDEGCIGMFDKN